MSNIVEPVSDREPRIVVGLMSGTSADGIDAVLVRTDGEDVCEYLDFLSIPYESSFRQRLLKCAKEDLPEDVISEIQSQLTHLHAQAVQKLVDRWKSKSDRDAAVDLIGFHGHTIHHDPDQGVTRQIGDGPQLAKQTGIDVVFDFRSEDMRAGGQGAPLVPLFHSVLFADVPKPAVVLNLGGVGNVTWLDGDRIIAGDSGPGCGLLDDWVRTQTGEPFDRDGEIALQGAIDEGVLAQLRDLPFFAKPLPKSADRFDFGAIDVSHLSTEDGAATLCAVTAKSVVDAVASLGVPSTTWVTGGGAKHPLIMRLLAEGLGDVRPVEAAGFRSDSMEAECFAWLAMRRLRGLPTSIPSTTGCSEPTCGGQVAKSEP